MLVTTEGCDLELNRGPGWLFVRVRNLDPEGPAAETLADRVWALLEKHLTYRVVLELDDVELLRSILIAQLVLLQRRLSKHDGVIRLSGLSPHNRQVLTACRLADRLPTYDDRVCALMGAAPTRPR